MAGSHGAVGSGRALPDEPDWLQIAVLRATSLNLAVLLSFGAGWSWVVVGRSNPPSGRPWCRPWAMSVGPCSEVLGTAAKRTCVRATTLRPVRVNYVTLSGRRQNHSDVIQGVGCFGCVSACVCLPPWKEAGCHATARTRSCCLVQERGERLIGLGPVQGDEE
jgi:hypothetical protein